MTDPKIRFDILANAEGEEDVKRLSRELEKLDDAFDPATAARARDLAEKLRVLGQEKEAIGTFTNLKREVREASTNLDQAQAAAQKFGKEIAATETPTRAQVGQFEKLKDGVKAAKIELETKTVALGTARSALGTLGISTETLASQEVVLRDSIKAARTEIAQLGQQGQAVQRLQELGVATEGAAKRLQQANSALEAYRGTLSTTEAPTRSQVQQLTTLNQAARQAQIAFQDASLTQAQAATALRASGVNVDKLTTAQREVAKETDTATGAQKRNAQSLEQVSTGSKTATQQLGAMKTELVAAGAAVVGVQQVLSGAAKAASEFGTGMAEVATLLDDTSGLDELSETVRRVTREFGGQAPEQAKALYQIISAGATDSAKATDLLVVSNRLAVGGVTDVKTAADGLTSILNAYGEKAGTATEVSDALFVAMKAGKTTVGELSSSIGQVAPLAAQAGVGIDQLLAATAALTKGGVTTSQSVTQLRGVISAVVKPTKEAADLALELGLQFDTQALKAKGLAGFLEDVRKKTGGNTESMAILFGQVEALGGVLALTGNQAGSFGEILQNMERRAGATEEAFGKLATTPAFASRQLQAALADVQIALGQAVTSFTPLLQATTSALSAFNELPGPIKTTTAGVAAAAVAVPVLTVALGSVARALGLARAALLGKAAAATAVVAPVAAAAAGTAALGVASAAAAPKIGAAATATTLLARGLSLVKAALPIGLILTFVELTTEFFRAKKAAEDADKAVEAMLRPRPNNGVAVGAKAASDALDATAGSADATSEALTVQAAAARRAAEALGVDLAKASATATTEFGRQIERLDDLEKNLEGLRAAGVDTGRVVSDALAKMLDGAKNQAELDTLRTRIEALGKAGAISKTQVVDLLDSLKAKADEAMRSADKLTAAYKVFGITSKAELEAVAAKSAKAWELIRNDATLSLAQKQAAFKKYADDAIAANGGVATSTILTEAQSLKLAVQADATGKVIVKSMGEAGEAVRKVGKYYNEAGEEVNKFGERINALASGINGRAGTADLTGVRSPGTAGAADAQGNLPKIDSYGDLIRNTPGTGITRTGSGQFQPPDNSGDWLFDVDKWNRSGQPVLSDMSAFWRKGSVNSGFLVDPRQQSQPGVGGLIGFSPAPAPAPAPATSPAAAPTPSNYQVNVTIGGRSYGIGAADKSAADTMIRALEEAYRAGGGG